MTTNPTIFAAALAKGNAYDDAPPRARRRRRRRRRPRSSRSRPTTSRPPPTSFRPVYDRTGGVDGRVSIEVDPGLAHDTAGTIARGQGSSGRRSTVRTRMIKIPATVEGLEAITAAIASRHQRQRHAHLQPRAPPRGHRRLPRRTREGEGGRHRPVDDPLGRLVLRLARRHRDRQAPRRRSAPPRRVALKSKAGVANARLAYQLFEEEFATDRAKALLAAGANRQRPLWASTGVKDPRLPDTLYVTELVAAGVVNTMPEKTLEATFDHGVTDGDTVTGAYAEAQRGARRARALSASTTTT